MNKKELVLYIVLVILAWSFVLLKKIYVNTKDRNENTISKLTDAKFLDKIIVMDSIPNDTIICFQYGLVNIGTNNLIIEDLNPSCSCSECYALDSIVLPNDTTQILMYINMKEKVGLNKVNTIVTLNKKTELYKLSAIFSIKEY